MTTSQARTHKGRLSVRFGILAGLAACIVFGAFADARAFGDEPAEKPKPIVLFDGKTLDGWKPNELPENWKVIDGAIVTSGPRSHLFYFGKDESKPAEFTNFHFKADVMTTPGSNSGLFFHTKFQPDGWPANGYEAQVNNSHGDPVKTASLYNTVKNFEAPAKDNEWFTEEIIVEGKHIVTKVNGKTIVDYTEPDDKQGTVKLSKGTFAIQAHDPKSSVKFKNIQVKPLP